MVDVEEFSQCTFSSTFPVRSIGQFEAKQNVINDWPVSSLRTKCRLNFSTKHVSLEVFAKNITWFGTFVHKKSNYYASRNGNVHILSFWQLLKKQLNWSEYDIIFDIWTHLVKIIVITNGRMGECKVRWESSFIFHDTLFSHVFFISPLLHVYSSYVIYCTFWTYARNDFLFLYVFFMFSLCFLYVRCCVVLCFIWIFHYVGF